MKEEIRLTEIKVFNCHNEKLQKDVPKIRKEYEKKNKLTIPF